MKKLGLMALFTAAGAFLQRVFLISALRGRRQAEQEAEQARHLAEERTSEIITLKNLAETLNQTLPPSGALEAGLEMVAQRYAASSAWLLTVTPEQQAELTAGYRLPPSLEKARRTEKPWSLCACLQETLSGQLHTVQRFRCERLAHDPSTRQDQKHHLSIPIRASGVPVGILNLVLPTDRTFDEAELQLLSALGDQFGGAVERARLFKEIHKLAITDSLTGLYNRRHFFTVASQEFERSRRYGHSFTLAMIDLDNFKNINDHYGHLSGDQALVAVAQLCQRMVRRVDTVGRYGGEEIVILMPETGEVHALRALERLRAAVEQMPVETPRGQVSLTISAGVTRVASLAETDLTLEALLDQADRALYQAKQNGRNQVCAYQQVNAKG